MHQDKTLANFKVRPPRLKRMDKNNDPFIDLSPDPDPAIVTNENTMPHTPLKESLHLQEEHASDIFIGPTCKQKFEDQHQPDSEVFKKIYPYASEPSSNLRKRHTRKNCRVHSGDQLISIDSSILRRWDQVGIFENLMSHSHIAAFLVHFYENTKSSTTNSGGQCIRCSAPLSPVCHACSLSSQGNLSETLPISRPFHPDVQFVSELSSSAQEGAKALTDHKEVKNTDKSAGRKAEAVLTQVSGGKSAEPMKTRKHSTDGIVTTGNVFGVPEWSQRRKRIMRSLERRTRGQHRQNKLKSKCAVRAEIALVCSICGEQFKKSDNLVSHFHQQHHGEKKPFKCVHCDTKLSSVISLTVHMRRHTGEKPFVCQICGAAFAQSSHLIGHKLTHSGYKPYKCVECGTAFSSSSHLTVHMRSHSGVRPFLCHECGAAFTASGHLKVHMRKHTGERPFVCSECGSAFSQSGNLREHKKKHEDKVNAPKVPPERNFICTQCGATFIRANHMKVHMRKHSDERPFRCKDCGKAFFESSSLKSHTRIHTGEKPFKCNQCDAAFANSSNLKVHTRKHTGEKPFSCEICGATFTQSNSVHTHMRRKHMNSLA